MTGDELLEHCRLRLRDTAEPKLWSDALITEYLAKAERIFAERTHTLQDFSTYTVTTVQGQAAYALDPVVLAVLVAQVSTEARPLARINSVRMSTFSATESLPRSFTVRGGIPATLELALPADAVYTINLGVATRPTAPLTLVTVPEIPEQYHLDLVDYVVQECFVHADADGFAPEVSAIAESRWNMALKQAKRDVYHTMHTNNTRADMPNWTGAR
jgi:hypothetical protein